MNKQQLEEILNNAPEGATHYNPDGCVNSIRKKYIKLFGSSSQYGWVSFNENSGEFDTHSDIDEDTLRLSDLQTQLDQLNEIERLSSALDAALRACYDLDAHSVRHNNNNYNLAMDIQEELNK